MKFIAFLEKNEKTSQVHLYKIFSAFFVVHFGIKRDFAETGFGG
jgi:hypothetical protein